MPRSRSSNGSKDSTATIGFEAKLWLAADAAMRDSAINRRGAILRSPSKVRDNVRNFTTACI